jgi:hypothetical protein
LLVVCEGNKGVYCMVTAMMVSETVDCGNAEAQYAVFLYEKEWKSSEESIWKAATKRRSLIYRAAAIAGAGESEQRRRWPAMRFLDAGCLDAWMGSKVHQVRGGWPAGGANEQTSRGGLANVRNEESGFGGPACKIRCESVLLSRPQQNSSSAVAMTSSPFGGSIK